MLRLSSAVVLRGGVSISRDAACAWVSRRLIVGVVVLGWRLSGLSRVFVYAGKVN